MSNMFWREYFPRLERRVSNIYYWVRFKIKGPPLKPYPRYTPITDNELWDRRRGWKARPVSVLCYVSPAGHSRPNSWIQGERVWVLFDVKQFKNVRYAVQANSFKRTYFPFNVEQHYITLSFSSNFARTVVEYAPNYDGEDPSDG